MRTTAHQTRDNRTISERVSRTAVVAHVTCPQTRSPRYEGQGAYGAALRLDYCWGRLREHHPWPGPCGLDDCHHREGHVWRHLSQPWVHPLQNAHPHG